MNEGINRGSGLSHSRSQTQLTKSDTYTTNIGKAESWQRTVRGKKKRKEEKTRTQPGIESWGTSATVTLRRKLAVGSNLLTLEQFAKSTPPCAAVNDGHVAGCAGQRKDHCRLQCAVCSPLLREPLLRFEEEVLSAGLKCVTVLWRCKAR